MPGTRMTSVATLFLTDHDTVALFAGPNGEGYVATSRAEDRHMPELERYDTLKEAQRAYADAVAEANNGNLYDHEVYTHGFHAPVS